MGPVLVQDVSLKTGGSRTDSGRRGGLTYLGWIVIGLCCTLLSTFLWQAQPLALYLGLGFVGALAVNAVVSRRSISTVRTRWLLPACAHAGEVVTVGALVESDQPATACTILHQDPMTDTETETCRLPGVYPTPTRIAWNLRFPRRGLVPVPALRCSSTHPFGLIQHTRICGDPTDFIVLPMLGQVHEDIELLLRQWRDMGPTSVRHGNEEFSHLRSYRPGDSLRRIHWRASARARTLLVGERHDPELESLSIYLDTRCRVAGSRRLERLISIAATLVDHLAGQQWQVRLYGPFTDDNGLVGSTTQLLAAMALAEATGHQEFSLVLAPGEVCLVFTLDRKLEFPIAGGECRIIDLDEAEGLVHLGRMPR